jgi:hypothetical protein
MATATALGLHWNMFVDERPLLVDMALVADGIAAGESPSLAYGRGAMRVMAVIALDQPFVDPVVIRLGKIGLGRNMASVAQLRLVLD